jgi:nucleoside transporter
MMFLQYLLLAVWWVPLAAYLTNIGVEGSQKALILSSMALGSMISPIIGMLADRYFSSEKVMTVINLVSAFLLFLAAKADSPLALFWVLLVAMLLQMPTWSLSSSIAMTHAPSDKFARIRVFGSLGWVASGFFSIIAVKFFNLEFDGTNLPFYSGFVVSIVAAIVNLTLPKTPPPAKGKKVSIKEALGLGSIGMMKDRNFSIFVVLSFLFMIPFAIYFSYCSEFLLDKGFKYITFTMNLGQVVEMALLLTIPFLINKTGLRNVLLFGLVALLIRYIAFYFGGTQDQSWMYFIGILLHGAIFGYFFVGGQIYINNMAPQHLRAQTQGFYFLITMGAGMLIGNFFNGWLIKATMDISETGSQYNWDKVWAITTLLSFIVLTAFILFFRIKEKKN